MATSSLAGFDIEFVEQPPKAVQIECPVCLQILREPYQAPCCGYSFCKLCIEKVKADNMPCPTCKEENFVTFYDKRLQRSLSELHVYCSHKQEGCEWKGELGQFNNHLNLSPQPDKRLEGCGYSEIECIYCSELITRCNINVHQTDHCPKRPFSCEYCHSYETHYEDVINNHWPVCGYHPVQCPNECGTFPQRQVLDNHITRDCPNIAIDCDFRHVGCDVRLPRKDLPSHLNENLVTHMSLQVVSYSKLLAELQTNHRTLQKKVYKLESENEALKEKVKTSHKENQQAATKVNRLERKIQTLERRTQKGAKPEGHDNKSIKCQLELTQRQNQEMSERIRKIETDSGVMEQIVKQLTQHIGLPTPPDGYVELTMGNYENYKRKNDQWLSLPFYSHPQGYKFYLRVDANGSGDYVGTHVSVFLYLMKGKFDDQLKWPFCGKCIFQLVDKKGEEKDHHSLPVAFDEKTPASVTSRVTQGDRGEGWGHCMFVSLDKLYLGYLENGSLCFRIKFYFR